MRFFAASDLTANRAFLRVVSAGRAEFPAKIDDLQMSAVPLGFGKEPFQVAFRPFDGRAVRKSPSHGEPVDVRIDGKRGESEGLPHEDACGFVADAREAFEFGKCPGNFAVKLLQENFRKLDNVPAFCGSEPAGPDDFLDFRLGKFRHLLWRIRPGEEFRGYRIDLSVRALCAQKHGDEKGERIGKLQGNRRIRIEGVQLFGNEPCAFLPVHRKLLGRGSGTFDVPRKVLLHFEARKSRVRTPHLDRRDARDGDMRGDIA